MKHNQGLTFFEVIIATTIFIIFAIGVYQAYTTIFTTVANTRHRALAADLANARFEVIKNMPYTSVGVSGGNPPGIVVASETVVSDKVNFLVETTIVNVDDPFDGVAGAGDVFPADYKLVEIKITCQGCKNLTPITFTGLVAPKNLEST